MGASTPRNVAFAVLLLPACSAPDPRPPPLDDFNVGREESCEPAEPPEELLQQAGTLAGGEFWNCRPPDTGSGDSCITSVTGTEATVTGSTAVFELEWEGTDNLDGYNLLLWYGSGYFSIPIGPPSGGQSASDELSGNSPLVVELVIAGEARRGQVTLHFALDDGTSEPPAEVCPPAQADLFIIPVGNGDVQVSLNWNTLTDVDLHVTDPTGERIFFGNPRSLSGGELDLDSYAICNFNDPGRGNENVFWGVSQAPRGRYIVEVDMFTDCGTYSTNQATDYRVTVIRDRSNVTSFDGQLGPTTPQNQLVTEFDY